MAMKKLEAVKQKATAIADQPDLNARSKNSLMQKLYAKVDRAKSREGKKEVVVAKKGAKGNRGRAAKGALMVDRRMKADTRGMEKGRGKGKGKGKGPKGKPAKGGKPRGKAGGKK